MTMTMTTTTTTTTTAVGCGSIVFYQIAKYHRQIASCKPTKPAATLALRGRGRAWPLAGNGHCFIIGTVTDAGQYAQSHSENEKRYQHRYHSI